MGDSYKMSVDFIYLSDKGAEHWVYATARVIPGEVDTGPHVEDLSVRIDNGNLLSNKEIAECEDNACQLFFELEGGEKEVRFDNKYF